MNQTLIMFLNKISLPERLVSKDTLCLFVCMYVRMYVCAEHVSIFVYNVFFMYFLLQLVLWIRVDVLFLSWKISTNI